MTIRITPMAGPFGAYADEVGASLLAPSTVEEVIDALYEHRIVVLRDVSPSRDDYVCFGRCFGEPITFFDPGSRNADFPELIEIHNSPTTPDVLRDGAMHWHQDSSYESAVASVTMLSAIEAPDRGNETMFADLTAAYDALGDDAKDRIEDLVVRHDPLGGRVALEGENRGGRRRPGRSVPEVVHRLVLQHPVTRRRALYGISGTASGIVGLDDAEGVELLLELKRHALQPQFRQTTRAIAKSILIWDNLAVMHSATPTEYSDEAGKRRMLHRISIRSQ